MKSKSIFLKTVLILLIVFFVISMAPAKTKLVFWCYMEGKSQIDTLDWICKTFNESQNEIEVERQYVPFADFKKQLSIGMMASKLPDIVVIDNPDHAAFAQTGIFADLTNNMSNWADKDKYFPGPWKSTTLNGKNYGVPFTSNCLALFYNVDMLKEAGIKPPQTWKELRTAAKKLTKKNIFGLGISAVRSEEGTFQFLPWLLSSGADIAKLDSKEAISSYSILRDLIKDGSMPKEVINWTQADVEKQFAAGKLAMMVNGPWNIPQIKSDAPNLKWDVVKIPKDKVYASVLGGENWALVNGKNVEAAWKFLQFVADPKIVKEISIKINMFPPRKDVAVDKAWTADPIMSIFMDEMQYAMPRGPHPKWPQISDAISTALQEVLTMKLTPEKATQKAQKAVKNALKSK
jgi:multiple sugar transport system substrate-binding protein